MKKCLTLTLAVFAIMASGKDATALTRGCAARYDLVFLLIDNGKPTKEKRISFGAFNTRGSCKNKIHANDCRREARDLAHSCFNAHWAGRWGIEGKRQKPGQCYRQRANMGPQDYSMEDLKLAIEKTACCHPAAPGFSQFMTVRVEGITTGDKRCGKTSTLSSSYRITPEICAAVDSKSCGGE